MLEMNVSFSNFAKPAGGAYVVGAFEGGVLTNQAKAADKQSHGQLKKAIAASGRFTGAKGQSLELLAPSGLKVQRLILVGLGKPEDFDGLRAEELGGTVTAHLLTAEKQLTFAIDHQKGMKVDAGELAARIAFGAVFALTGSINTAPS
jgi:leucyl aminopeptidase